MTKATRDAIRPLLAIVAAALRLRRPAVEADQGVVITESGVASPAAEEPIDFS